MHQRYPAIDRLRGLVMVLMVLDHSRDFLGASNLNPRDVSDPLLFLTRWVTHFCAPVFVFLAGASAWLAARRYRQRWQVGRYLMVRGAWLILLELSLVRMGWTFSLRADFILLQVLWVLGWGLIVLALLLPWPPWLVGCCGALILVTHNLLDHIEARSFGPAAWLWVLLHQPQLLSLSPQRQVWALYALIPWIGVIACGYGFGRNLVPGVRRRRFFLAWGACLTGLFVLLRWLSVYGDPQPWQQQATWLASALAFVNCEKYPPSLQFLLMTLGPALLLFPFLGSDRSAVARVLLTFGRVPLLFYLLHLPLLHGLAVLVAALNHQSVAWLFGGLPLLHKPAGYGLPLIVVYLAWLLSLVVLYVPCRWLVQARS